MAINAVSLKLWDENPQISRDFKFVTKFSNLGDDLYKKSILGSYINWNSLIEDKNYNINVYVRKSLEDSFVLINNISASDYGFKTGSFNNTHMLMKPDIFVVDFIQIKIEGTVRNGFDVNDFGLVFRKHRSSSSSEFNED